MPFNGPLKQVIGDKLYSFMSNYLGRLIIGDRLYTIISNYSGRMVIGEQTHSSLRALFLP